MITGLRGVETPALGQVVKWRRGWGVKGPGAGVERDTEVQASGGLQPVAPAEGLPLLTRLLRGDAVAGLGSPGPRTRGRGGTHL